MGVHSVLRESLLSAEISGPGQGRMDQFLKVHISGTAPVREPPEQTRMFYARKRLAELLDARGLDAAE